MWINDQLGSCCVITESYWRILTHSALFLQGLFEWLKSAELKSTEEFLVGSDLGSVREQLCDLKVRLTDLESPQDCSILTHLGHGFSMKKFKLKLLFISCANFK